MSKKITSPADLKALQQQAQRDIDLRGGPKDMRITVHMGTCGIAAGAREILSSLMGELGQAQVNNVTIQQSGCAGLCDQEPMMTLTDKAGESFRYGRLDKNKVREIVHYHVLGGKSVNEYMINV